MPKGDVISVGVLKENNRPSQEVLKRQIEKWDTEAKRLTETHEIPMQRGTLEGGAITNPEQRILNAVAWMESIKIDQPDKRAVAFLADYSSGTGAFNNACGSLRTKGLITYPSGGLISLTESGRTLAQFPDNILTQEELHRMVLNKLPNPNARILKVLLDHYPNSIPSDELAEKSGYMPDTGAFNNAKGRLRTLGLINYPQPGQVVAESLLFLD